eukprot:TRINITY_DN6771_c0_g1_i4.p1 TRINITY_DN6771_c0_g1~~TRINITY_DN6771_c0_g1_i4.p1  ORF type:complete len:414 (+),score=100.16 TRINITY_DN6771_c0_g1_i4:54-1244(+)
MVSCKDLTVSMLSYSTVKVVQIKDWRLGLIHYSIMGLIFIYVVGYVIFFDSGYQSQSPVVGYTATKVKGSALGDVPGEETALVWDSVDMIVPPIENSALFVSTNIFTTKKQSRGTWVDTSYACDSNNPCTAGNFTEWGLMLGPCVNGTDGSESGCLIQGWGPVEAEFSATPASVLNEVENWTAFIRCSVYFSMYDKRADNIGTELVPNYNLFVIGDMLKDAGTSFEDAAAEGAIISVSIDWTCSFDPWSRACEPEFTFARLDDPSQKFSKGFNFRYANYYYLSKIVPAPAPNTTAPNDTATASAPAPDHVGADFTLESIEYRDLFKVYGIRFVFQITGAGYRFSVVPLFVNIGSGLGLLVIATVITDVIAVCNISSPPLPTCAHADSSTREPCPDT